MAPHSLQVSLSPDPAGTAQAAHGGAGLRHVSDLTLPGITRHRSGDGFTYRLPNGERVRDETELQRIRKLAIPPAYTDVWICPRPDGHLQATGRDARGRKQYRYHAEWNAGRSSDKFERLEAFGRALSRVRRRVARDLGTGHSAIRKDGISRSLILATLVRLLDTTFVRIGNASYTRENGSFGLTTLRNRHVGIQGKRVQLSFRGKHGITQTVSLDDPRVTSVIRRCKQLPGQELFQYQEDDALHGISSGDVNDYIAEAAGERFTAKDFRTWHGSVQALELTRLACCSSDPELRKTVTARHIVSAVAAQLGNTEAVCKKAYIHPAVLALAQQLAQDSGLPAPWAAAATESVGDGLRAAEKRLLQLLAHSRRKQPRKQPAPRRNAHAARAKNRQASH